MKFKILIDDITFYFWSSRNCANINDIRRKWDPTINLWKFTYNKKILIKVIILGYNQVCCQTFFNFHLLFN